MKLTTRAVIDVPATAGDIRTALNNPDIPDNATLTDVSITRSMPEAQPMVTISLEWEVA